MYFGYCKFCLYLRERYYKSKHQPKLLKFLILQSLARLPQAGVVWGWWILMLCAVVGPNEHAPEVTHKKKQERNEPLDLFNREYKLFD